MNGYLAPFFLGGLKLSCNLLCSPLAGCSDYPFRKMIKKFDPGLIFCEMVKMEALVRHDPTTFRLLDYDGDMHPIGAQLCGSNPSIAKEAARIIEDLGFDLIDLNCGCPVDKVTKDGSGSGMLKYPEKIGEILSNIRAAVKIPVTVKVRAGWDESQIVAPEIVKIAEKAGACAISVHGRTRQQGYRGPANWDWIKECKQAANKILVIGNGDIIDGPSAEEMLRTTGCDALLISRGSFGKPWIFQEIKEHLTGQSLSSLDPKEVLMDHFQWMLSYYSEKRALIHLRRIVCWYLKGKDKARVRERLMKASSSFDAHQLIMGL